MSPPLVTLTLKDMVTKCAIERDQDFSNNFSSGKRRMGNMAVRADIKHGVLVAGLRTSCLGGGISTSDCLVSTSWLAHLIASGSAFWRNRSPLSSRASYEKSFGKDAFPGELTEPHSPFLSHRCEFRVLGWP